LLKRLEEMKENPEDDSFLGFSFYCLGELTTPQQSNQVYIGKRDKPLGISKGFIIFQMGIYMAKQKSSMSYYTQVNRNQLHSFDFDGETLVG
jgi:hypothetical protein